MPYTPITAPYTKYTDFVGEIRVPGLNPATDLGAGNIAELERFITKYEKKLYIMLLSETVYNAMVAALAGESTPDAKWTDLHAKLTANPMAANYVYYWYRRDGETSTGMTNEVQNTQENAIVQSANMKMCRAWNEMSEWVVEFVAWLINNEATYGVQTTYDVNLYQVERDLSPINMFNI